MNGADILIRVGENVVGSQRDVTINETTAEIDISSKNERERRVAAGRYSSTITLDALYVPTDAAYLELKTAMRNGTLVEVVRVEEGHVLEWANAVVTSLSEKGPDQDAATVSIGLAIDGAWMAGS